MAVTWVTVARNPALWGARPATGAVEAVLVTDGHELVVLGDSDVARTLAELRFVPAPDDPASALRRLCRNMSYLQFDGPHTSDDDLPAAVESLAGRYGTSPLRNRR